MVSLLGYKIWEYIVILFDDIPKIMYFLYAAIASALDAMQCLMRRLAGLDLYYVGGSPSSGGWWQTDMKPVPNQDPVLEFIYGILGIGDNAAAYTGLQTVFWSLAIFGLIVLVLSTIVAIIKAHYQEDASKTSPVTHLYTALKAILTFAIVPAVVIVGFWLSGFLLRTLDTIIAGSATSEAMLGTYGPSYADAFEPGKPEGDDSNNEYYSRYDFFGAGRVSTTTSFSGILFRTCANNANRIRTESFDYTQGGTGGVRVTSQSFYDFDIFGKWFPESIEAIGDPDEKREQEQEWVAYQIDYAFMNNLFVNGRHIYAEELYAQTNILLTIETVDVFSLLSVIPSFSKYNVGLVWYYYNLWQFNFMIGVIAILCVFFLFISIIVGLMRRLLKCAALFLIYPAVLGLNPLDGGEAFKKWRQEFMGYALGSFGSIIGMNLFFLIFPYVDNIKFFGFWPLDGMVNIVIITAGLLMIKELISFISELVGGKDLAKEGGDAAKEIGSKLVQGGMLVAGGAAFAAKASAFTGMGVGRTLIKGGVRQLISDRKANKQLEDSKYKEDVKDENGNIIHHKGDTKEGINTLKMEAGAEAQTAYNELDEAKTARSKLMLDPAYAAKRAEVEASLGVAADRLGLTGIKKQTYINANLRDALHEKLMSGDDSLSKQYQEDYSNLDAEVQRRQTKYDNAERKNKEYTDRQSQILAAQTANSLDSGGVFKDAAAGAGRMMAKSFKEGLKTTGLDKLMKGFGSVLQSFTPYQYNDKGEAEKLYDANPFASVNKAVANSAKANGGGLGGLVLSMLAPPREPDKKLTESEQLKESSTGMQAAADKITQAADVILKTFEKWGRGRR